MAALLMVAAVPVVVLAAFIAWQNYRGGVEQSLERVRLLRAATAAQDRAALEGVAPVLLALAAHPEVAGGDVGACHHQLAEVRALLPQRLTDLAVLHADGAVLCRAADAEESAAPITFAGTPWFRRLRAEPRILYAAASGPGEPGAVVVAVPRSGPSGFAGAVVAWPRIGVPEPPAAAAGNVPVPASWLIDPSGNLVPLGGVRPSEWPTETLLAALQQGHGDVVLARSQRGEVFAYAVAPLTGGLRLLVATPAAADIAAARVTLLRQLSGLALLLGAGLAAVAVGADRALVQPIKRLSAAVQAWRDSGVFDPGPQTGLPREVRHLTASFADAAAALAKREQELRQAAEQQELLMQEIHHRVKNNLQIVASLLNLQASRIRLPEAKREFASARDRVRALATLHRHLYAHGDLRTINMQDFLHELCEQLLHAVGEPTGTRIELDVEAPALQLESDQAVPLALIVTEAVNNAAKHAFPGERSGRIRVTLGVEGAILRLLIQDDGVGIPEGEEAPPGIGMQLIRGFARQLGAELTIVRDGGTRYELLLDLRRTRAGDKPESAPAKTPEA
jgi:two-component sensor histidine kinase